MSNIVLNPGSGGSTLATDTVSGVDTQIVKIGYSVAGVAPTQVSSSNPLPVTLQTAGATQPVSGTVSVGNFPATQAVTQSGTWTVQQGTPPWTIKPDGTGWTLTGTSANVNLTNATLAVTQSGTWTTGRTWTLASGTDTVTTVPSGTQTVTGTVTANAGTGSFTVAQATAANLNATVTGTVAATQSGTWNIGSITTLPSIPAGSNAIGSVSVSNFPATQPVSGTVTANAGTGSFTVAQATAANLNATVTGTVAATQSGTWNINAITTLPAITGTVTANQGSANATPWNENIAQWNGAVPSATNPVYVSPGTGATFPISAASLPLPTGAMQQTGGSVTLAAGTNNVGQVVVTDSSSITQLLAAILTEMRVMTAMLQSGLNVQDDPDTLRNDPYYNSSVIQ